MNVFLTPIHVASTRAASGLTAALRICQEFSVPMTEDSDWYGVFSYFQVV